MEVNRPFPLPDLTQKLFIFMSYFPYDRQNGTWSTKSNEKGILFNYNFLNICRYSNLIKKLEDNFIANRKFTSCYNIKILGENICYFH